MSSVLANGPGLAAGEAGQVVSLLVFFLLFLIKSKKKLI